MTEQTAALPEGATVDPTINLDQVEEKKPEGEKPEGEQAKPDPDPKPEGAEDDGEGDEDEDNGKDAAEGEKGLSRSQRRRLQLQRERERADRLERELAAERSRKSAAVPTDEDSIKAEVERRVGKPPKQEDFADVFEFEAERAAYLADRRAVEREVRRDAEAEKGRREAARGQIVRDHLDRVEAFKKEAPDFDQVVRDMDGKVFAEPHVEELIITSPDSGRLIYHLLKNPAEVAKLNKLSERDAAREMGRIEAKLQRPATTKTTKAPAPVSTSPKGGASPTADPAKMEMDEYVRWRQSQKKG